MSYLIHVFGTKKNSGRVTSSTILRPYPLTLKGVQRILDKEDQDEQRDYTHSINVERVENWSVE